MARAALVLFVTFGSLASVTREEILARAESFADLTWDADTANTFFWDTVYYRWGYASGGCEEHRTSDWTPGKTYQGMAYGYGQNDDTTGYIQRLKESWAAGNHMCHYLNYGDATGIYPPDWAAGIDCSAFVCRSWGVLRTNSTGIYEKYYPLDKKDVQPGDVLVNPGHHVVLIADPGSNPPYGTLAIYEASGSSCRVWHNPFASWATYAGYAARSLFNPGVEDSTADSSEELISRPWIARQEVILRFPKTPGSKEVRFAIHNALGERVYEGKVSAPGFEFLWSGYDDRGQKLPSGVYYVRTTPSLETGSQRFIFIR